jgi:hypothetical protein
MYGTDGIVNAVLRNFAVINLTELAQSELLSGGRGRKLAADEAVKQGAAGQSAVGRSAVDQTVQQLGVAIALAGFSQSAEPAGAAVQVQTGEPSPPVGPDLRYAAAGAVLPALVRRLVHPTCEQCGSADG